MAHLLHRIGAFAVRRRRTVLVGWLLAFALLGGLAAGFKGTFSSEFTIPGTESQQAAELIAERIPGANADAASRQGRLRGTRRADAARPPSARPPSRQTVEALGKVTDVASATDPFATQTISKDGRIAYTDLTFTVAPRDVTATQTDAIAAATEAAEQAGIQVEYGGVAAPVEAETPIGEVLGVVVALVVLTVTFGSLLAAGLPLLTGVLGVAFGALGHHAGQRLHRPDRHLDHARGDARPRRRHRLHACSSCPGTGPR